MKFDKKLWDEWDGCLSEREEMIEEHGCKKIALMKWHPDNPNQGFGECSYCTNNTSTNCTGCPLKGVTCGGAGSIYSRWVSTKRNSNGI
jgi:hypothetical protein